MMSHFARINMSDGDACSVFEGEDLQSALMGGKLDHITHIELYESVHHRVQGTTYCDIMCGGISNFLLLILQCCPRLHTLTINGIHRSHMEHIFSALPRYPAEYEMNSVVVLELRHMHFSREDMEAIGPCFPNAKQLIWYMNRFDEVIFDNYVMPYFDGDNLSYENDDGWWPGCELGGDGQLTQSKGCPHY
jgi:hypothetical protein